MKPTSKRKLPNLGRVSRQGTDRKALRRKSGQQRPPAESTRQDYRFLSEAVVLAAERFGNSGRDGLVGYLVWLARTQPRSFAALLARTPPDAVIGNKPEEQREVTVRIFKADGTLVETVRNGVVIDPADDSCPSEMPASASLDAGATSGTDLNEDSEAPMKGGSAPGAATFPQENGHKTLRGKRQKTQRSSESTREEYESLLEAVFLAAEQVGEDNLGRGGLVGYLLRLARTEPRCFATLLSRVQLEAIIGEKSVERIVTLNIFDKKINCRRYWR
jgi:hypothetical protein